MVLGPNSARAGQATFFPVFPVPSAESSEPVTLTRVRQSHRIRRQPGTVVDLPDKTAASISGNSNHFLFHHTGAVFLDRPEPRTVAHILTENARNLGDRNER